MLDIWAAIMDNGRMSTSYHCDVCHKLHDDEPHEAFIPTPEELEDPKKLRMARLSWALNKGLALNNE